MIFEHSSDAFFSRGSDEKMESIRILSMLASIRIFIWNTYTWFYAFLHILTFWNCKIK